MVDQTPTGSNCKIYQFALLNISTGYKQNDVVIVTTQKIEGEHENLYTHTLCTQIHDTHMYTHTTFSQQ